MSVKMKFNDLEGGFFRWHGKIYFAGRHGRWVHHFPVMDGKISRRSDDSIIYPDDRVEVLPREEWEENGISHIEWVS